MTLASNIAHETFQNSLSELIEAWKTSPYQSNKNTSYFHAYVTLFNHLRGTPCTFVEIGVQRGGSLFMWRKWLGDRARIIGIDLNPEVAKWRDHGFEIYVGDQGDPDFWKSTLKKIGDFDVLLDDGGHQAFQQIITVQEILRDRRNKCVVVVEDTATSFMKDFTQRHDRHSFLEYAKDVTDCLTGRSFKISPGRYPENYNSNSVDFFRNVFSVRFFNEMVAFEIDSASCLTPVEMLNKEDGPASDFRYAGKSEALVEWPNILEKKSVLVKGGNS